MRSIDELAKACAPAKNDAPVEEMKLDDNTLSKFLDKIADRVIEKLSNPNSANSDAGSSSDENESSEADQGEADQSEGGDADG